MKKCELCGTKIKKNNDASIGMLGVELIERVRKNHKTVQSVCIECKRDLLYANILSPY